MRRLSFGLDLHVSCRVSTSKKMFLMFPLHVFGGANCQLKMVFALKFSMSQLKANKNGEKISAAILLKDEAVK